MSRSTRKKFARRVLAGRRRSPGKRLPPDQRVEKTRLADVGAPQEGDSAMPSRGKPPGAAAVATRRTSRIFTGATRERGEPSPLRSPRRAPRARSARSLRLQRRSRRLASPRRGCVRAGRRRGGASRTRSGARRRTRRRRPPAAPESRSRVFAIPRRADPAARVAASIARRVASPCASAATTGALHEVVGGDEEVLLHHLQRAKCCGRNDREAEPEAGHRVAF